MATSSSSSSKASMYAYTIQSWGRKFPILLKTPSPKGHVELIEIIGKGNYGNVYKGKLTATGEVSAVKVVELKEDELKETLLEMEILAGTKHLNITRFMGMFLKNLDLWICMEFCGGGAMDSIYRGLKRNIDESTISVIMHDSLQGLNYLHTQYYLIHRDIKGGNIFLTEDGGCRLGDFGVSAKLTTANGRARTFIGTPYWMPPEAIACDPDSPSSVSASYDCKFDIWSIGITAIEIAEKNPPLADIHPMRALHMIPTTDIGFAKPKNFSANFRDFVAQCLIRDPRKRPSAEQMLQHPFLAKASAIGVDKRKVVLAELVQKYRKDRQRAREGYRGPVEEDTADPFAQFDQQPPTPAAQGPTPEQLAAQQAAYAQQQQQLLAQQQAAAAAAAQQQAALQAAAAKKAQEEAAAAKAAALAASITKAAQAQQAAQQAATAAVVVAASTQPPSQTVGVTATPAAQAEAALVESQRQALIAAEQAQLAQNGIVTPVPETVLTPEQQLQAQIGGQVQGDLPAPLPVPLPAPLPVQGGAKPAGPVPGGVGARSIVSPANFQTLTSSATKAFDTFGIGNTIDKDVVTGDFIGPYLLLGTEHNLYFVDTTRPVDQQMPIKLISDVRFRQIQVLEDYDVMLALSGRHRWVRQYRLRSLKKLILHMVEQTYGKGSVNVPLGATLKPSSTTESASTVVHGSLVFQGSSDEEYRRAQMGDTVPEDTTAKVARWTNDFIKLARTKFARSFLVERTTNSAHLLVLLGQDLVLYEWAVEPYLRFMQVKAFWLPELPEYISLLNDGFYIRDIWLGYDDEANLIRVEDAQVAELTVPEDLLSTAQRSDKKKKPRWESWVQIPFDDNIKNKLQTFGRSNSTINKKIRAAIAPTAGGKGIGDVPVLLLGTYGNITRVIDMEGRIVDTSNTGYGSAATHGYMITWTQTPKNVLLRPGSYVIAITEDTVEVASWRTGEILQVLKSPDGSPFQLLTYRDNKLYLLSGKKSATRVYMLQDMKLSGGVNVTASRGATTAAEV